jgi:hypothetical protein
MHSTLQSAARSLKKKMHRVSAQNEDSRFKQAAANFFFAAKVQISTSESGPKCIRGQRSKMSFQGYTSSCKFFIFYAPIWPLFSLFQDGVSGVLNITRYNDEGLKRRENSLISFPLEIKYMHEVYT